MRGWGGGWHGSCVVARVMRDGALTLFLVEGGRRKDVLDFGGADAEGERSEGAVRRRVRVAAHAGHSRDCEALLGPNRVHDALPLVGHPKVAEVELLHVALDGEHLLTALVVFDKRGDVGKLFAAVGRHVVLRKGEASETR